MEHVLNLTEKDSQQKNIDDLENLLICIINSCKTPKKAYTSVLWWSLQLKAQRKLVKS